MKKKTIFLLVITLIVMTLVSASSPRVRVGEQFFFPPGTGVMYYFENQPFHIAHGWRSIVNDPVKSTARGGLRFVLDGYEVAEDYVDFYLEQEDETTYLYKIFVFNFPTGMTGEHTFDFYYSNTCSIMLLVGEVSECEKPQEIVEVLYKSWVVHFGPIFAVDDEVTTPIGTPITINVLENDFYMDPIGVTLQIGPSNGLVGPWVDGEITYYPNPGFFGTDSFVYQIMDSSGQSDTATVTILVGP